MLVLLSLLGHSSLDEKILTLRICDDAGEVCQLDLHEITNGQVDAQEWSAAEKESARALVEAAIKRRAESGPSDGGGFSWVWLLISPFLVAIKNMAYAVAPEVVHDTTTAAGQGARAWWSRRSQGQRYGLVAGGAFLLCFLSLEGQCVSVTGFVALPFASELCELATHLGRFTTWLSSKALTLIMIVAALMTGGGGKGVRRGMKETGAVAVGTAMEAVVAGARWEVPWLLILLSAATLAGAWCMWTRPATQAQQRPPVHSPPVEPQTPPQQPHGVRREQRRPSPLRHTTTTHTSTPHTGQDYPRTATRNIPISQQQQGRAAAAAAAESSNLAVPVLRKDIKEVLGPGVKLPKSREALAELHRRHCS